ncbi:MAG: PhzF family phenazine biosynthesis protein [Gammaproteobacteria bacterium]|jgi:PhzF family phenazine biosynthesis protein
MDLLRIAAFSDGDNGGNPAGVVIADDHPPEAEMRRIASEVGYSETAFARPEGASWRVRYFSPESEVPFCGHATIALGAALAQQQGNGVFQLSLNEAKITVEGQCLGDRISAALQSPPTHSASIAEPLVSEVLELFGYSTDDLNAAIPPARIHGGADHLVFALKSRATLAAMDYELDLGRKLMQREGVITIMFVFVESSRQFHSRNPFASGGVFEDPATGAASAAFAGYLRDLGWPHQGSINIVQGEDMGLRSIIQAEISAEAGASIRVSGSARIIGPV